MRERSHSKWIWAGFVFDLNLYVQHLSGCLLRNVLEFSIQLAVFWYKLLPVHS